VPFLDGASTGRLSNGFSYLIVPRFEPAGIVELRWRVDHGGSRPDPRPDLTNEARLVQHLLLRRTFEQRAAGLEALELDGFELDRDDTGRISIFDSQYSLRTWSRTESIERALALILSWAEPLEVKEGDLQLERGLLSAEYRLRDTRGFPGLGDPTQVLGQIGRFAGVATSAAARIEALEAISPRQLDHFHGLTYRPGAMTLVVVGDVDPRVVRSQIKLSLIHI